MYFNSVNIFELSFILEIFKIFGFPPISFILLFLSISTWFSYEVGTNTRRINIYGIILYILISLLNYVFYYNYDNIGFKIIGFFSFILNIILLKSELEGNIIGFIYFPITIFLNTIFIIYSLLYSVIVLDINIFIKTICLLLSLLIYLYYNFGLSTNN
jgi:hypothetical protein